MVTTLSHSTIPGLDALPVLDLAAPDLIVEGNPRLAMLRAAGPLCWVQPMGGVGLLRWADCDQVLRDPKSFSSAFIRSTPVPGAEAETNYDTLLWQDPPEHTRVRRLVQQAFTPQPLAAMEPYPPNPPPGFLAKITSSGNQREFPRGF